MLGFSRRQQRDLWRSAAKAKDRKGDKAGARRARRAAKQAGTHLRDINGKPWSR